MCIEKVLKSGKNKGKHHTVCIEKILESGKNKGKHHSVHREGSA